MPNAGELVLQDPRRSGRDRRKRKPSLPYGFFLRRSRHNSAARSGSLKCRYHCIKHGQVPITPVRDSCWCLRPRRIGCGGLGRSREKCLQPGFGVLGGGSGGLLVGLGHGGDHLGPLDLDAAGRVEADLDRIAFDIQDSHHDVLANQDLFSDLPRKYQHLAIITRRPSPVLTARTPYGAGSCRGSSLWTRTAARLFATKDRANGEALPPFRTQTGRRLANPFTCRCG